MYWNFEKVKTMRPYFKADLTLLLDKFFNVSTSAIFYVTTFFFVCYSHLVMIDDARWVWELAPRGKCFKLGILHFQQNNHIIKLTLF